MYLRFFLSLLIVARSWGASPAPLVGSYARLPLNFEKNKGQTDAPVRFLTRGNGFALFLADNEAVLTLQKNATFLKNGARKSIRLQWATPRLPSGASTQPGKSNYFLGTEPVNWRRGI